MTAKLKERFKSSAFKLVATFELQLDLPLTGTDGGDAASEEASLRVEVFQSLSAAGLFRARIPRLEFFRLQPSFPQVDGEVASITADERVWNEMSALPPWLTSPQRFGSAEEALDFLLEKLAAWASEQLGSA